MQERSGCNAESALRMGAFEARFIAARQVCCLGSGFTLQPILCWQPTLCYRLGYWEMRAMCTRLQNVPAVNVYGTLPRGAHARQSCCQTGACEVGASLGHYRHHAGPRVVASQNQHAVVVGSYQAGGRFKQRIRVGFPLDLGFQPWFQESVSCAMQARVRLEDLPAPSGQAAAADTRGLALHGGARSLVQGLSGRTQPARLPADPGLVGMPGCIEPSAIDPGVCTMACECGMQATASSLPQIVARSHRRSCVCSRQRQDPRMWVPPEGP